MDPTLPDRLHRDEREAAELAAEAAEAAARASADESKRRGESLPQTIDEWRARSQAQRLTRLAVRAGLRNGDTIAVNGRRYRLDIEHGGPLDDLPTRTASSAVSSRDGTVYDADMPVHPDAVAIHNWLTDAAEAATAFAELAMRRIDNEAKPPTSFLARVDVAAEELGVAWLTHRARLSSVGLAMGATVLAMTPFAIIPAIPIGIAAVVAGVVTYASTRYVRDKWQAKVDDHDATQQVTRIRGDIHSGRAAAVEGLLGMAEALAPTPTAERRHYAPSAPTV